MRRVAVVAGGGRGIGEAVSLTLAADGATVAVLDRDTENAEHVRDAIVAAGGRATSAGVDVLDGDQIDAAVQRVLDEFGRIDVLANVAGGMVSYVPIRPLHEWSQDEWDLMISLNLTYVFRICRAVLGPMMAAGGGSIVNIASAGGVMASPRMAPYGAAKAAVIHLTSSLAVEYGHYGIRVNAVAPGTVATPATTGKAVGDVFDEAVRMIPLGRRGVPEDIARAVAFLASPRSDYVTGQTLVVDGGVVHRFPLPLPGADVSEASV